MCTSSKKLLAFFWFSSSFVCLDNAQNNQIVSLVFDKTQFKWIYSWASPVTVWKPNFWRLQMYFLIWKRARPVKYEEINGYDMIHNNYVMLNEEPATWS